MLLQITVRVKAVALRVVQADYLQVVNVCIGRFRLIPRQSIVADVVVHRTVRVVLDADAGGREGGREGLRCIVGRTPSRINGRVSVPSLTWITK